MSLLFPGGRRRHPLIVDRVLPGERAHHRVARGACRCLARRTGFPRPAIHGIDARHRYHGQAEGPTAPIRDFTPPRRGWPLATVVTRSTP
jgi:hypothetical protein